MTLPSRSTWGNDDEAWGSPGRRPAEPGDRAAVGGVELLGVAQADVVERRRMAGQAVVRRRVVVPHRVMDRADLGELSMTVANRGRCSVTVQAGLGRRDRLELAADAVGRVRLHVEGVDVRRAAELVQEEDVLRPAAQRPAPRRPAARWAGSAPRSPRCRPGAGSAARSGWRVGNREHSAAHGVDPRLHLRPIQ